jgi:hypothetical protein
MDGALCEVEYRNVTELIVEVVALANVDNSNFLEVGSQPFAGHFCCISNRLSTNRDQLENADAGDAVEPW